jgi:hypothetical protein
LYSLALLSFGFLRLARHLVYFVLETEIPGRLFDRTLDCRVGVYELAYPGPRFLLTELLCQVFQLGAVVPKPVL